MSREGIGQLIDENYCSQALVSSDDEKTVAAVIKIH